MPVGFMPLNTDRSYDAGFLSRFFGVDPIVFQGQNSMTLGQARSFLGSEGVQPAAAPASNPFSFENLFGTAMRDRNEAQRLADEQFARNQEAIGDLRESVVGGSERIRSQGQESADFLQDKLLEDRARNEQSAKLATDLAAEATQKAERESERFQRKVDQELGRADRAFKEAARAAETDVAVSIQNRRRAVDVEFGRRLEDAEAAGASSTEIQRLRQDYQVNLGMVAADAYDRAIDRSATINLGRATTMAQARVAGLGAVNQSMAQAQVARQNEVQTALGVAGIMASLSANEAANRERAEALRLQAEITADQLEVSGMQAVAELTMRNVPVYLPLSGILSQMLSLKAAMAGGGSWGGGMSFGPAQSFTMDPLAGAISNAEQGFSRGDQWRGSWAPEGEEDEDENGIRMDDNPNFDNLA